ncbi:MAG: AarF/UbiB family protein [Bacteroidales bacterium]
MKLLHIYTSYLEFCRFLQILKILVKHGFREWFYKTSIGKRHLRKHPQAHCQVKSTPERLRAVIEDLGPTYVKFGQILADRPDVLSDRFRAELKKLQSQVLPIADSAAKILIENELGESIEDVFEWFDPRCLAAASIGQVYQARLHSGQNVIIKIQRPHIENKIKLDIYLMRIIVRKFVKAYPEYAYMDVTGFVNEFAAQITSELDYYNEAENISRFDHIFKEDPTVHIPHLYSQYTTRRLLIMEKIQGISPDSIEKLKAQGLDLHQIAVNGANALLKMIMEEGFFHGDPHPGNIFIEDNNVVCFIDFGMTGVLRPREMNFIADFLLSFLHKNAKAMAKSLLALCGQKYYDQTDELEFELSTLIKKMGQVPLENINFANMMQSCISILIKHKLKVPSGLFMLAKTLLTLQKFAGNLDPEISLTPLILPYAKRLLATQYNPRKIATSIYDTLSDYGMLIKNFPLQVNEILYKLKEGKIKHEVQINDIEYFNKTLRQVGYRIISAILTVGLFIGSVLLLSLAPQNRYGHLLLGVSILLLIGMMIGIFFRKRK